jgi:hypothetical protein
MVHGGQASPARGAGVTFTRLVCASRGWDLSREPGEDRGPPILAELVSRQPAPLSGYECCAALCSQPLNGRRG